MPVAFDAVGPSSAGAGSGGTATLSWTHTVGTGLTNTILLVGYSWDDTSDAGVTAALTVDSSSTGVVSLGKVESDSQTAGFLQVWAVTGAGAAPGAHTVTVTPSATPSDHEGGSLSFSGASGTATPVTGHGTSATASVSVTAASGGIIAGFTAVGDTIVSSGNTSRFIKNQVGGGGFATGNAAGSTAAGTGSATTVSWTLTASGDPWAVLAVEVQAALTAQPPPGPVPQPPGWFPGAQAVTVDPGGIPFYAQPQPTDEAPAVIIPPLPEAAPFRAPALPPGWFPGADRVTTEPGGIPFAQQPPPADPSLAVLPPPAPDILGIADWLPLPPGYFPGSQTVTVDPGGIPFYSQPVPLLPATPPPPLPVITGQTSNGWLSYFKDQNGNPRLYVGAETWGLPGNAGRWNGGNWRGDYDAYHAVRFSQGYTANVTHPWGHTHTGCNNDLGHTWDGVFPFLVNGATADLTGQAGTITLNDPFWQRIDYMFSSAAGVGITVFFDLSMSNDMPAGAGHGFTNGVFQGATTAQIQTASQLIATRYAATQNLVWFFGDDYYNDDDTDYNAMRTGIAAADPRITTCTAIEYYPSGNTSRYDLSGAPGGETPHAWGNTYATYNFVYCYMQQYFGIEYAYTEPTQLGPVIWGDGTFWGNGGTSSQNDQLQRNGVWWSLSSGARGFVAEDETVLQWGSGALAAMTADGAFQATIKNIYTYFTGLAGWWKLIPDTGNALVTAGRGTRAVYSGSQYLANTDTYVTASRTGDGSLAVIYCANSMSITIDQSRLGAGYTATWVDPASLATQGTATGSTYSSSGLGTNSAGGNDWLLVLQGPPVTISATPAPVIPLAPGWFPGADRVTAVPGGVPFAQPPADPVGAVATNAVTAPAGLATVNVVAPQAQVALTVNAGVAAVSAVAPAPTAAVAAASAVATVSAVASPPTPAATATAAVGIAGAVAPAGSAAIAVQPPAATAATVAPPPPTVAATATAGVAIIGAVAPAPTVSTSGSTTAHPAVAVSQAVAPAPTAAVTANAGVATVSAVARAPSLAATVNTATAVVHATGMDVPPKFTVGTLTASDAPTGALTGATAAGGSGGVLTASDTRTGGPG